MALLASSEDLRLFLGSEEIETDRAEFILGAASAEIRKASLQTFELETEKEFTLDGPGSQVLLLPVLPVYNVHEIRVAGAVLSPSSYDWSEKGIVYCASGWGTRLGSIVVSCTYGFDTVPDDIRLLCCRVAGRAYVNPTGTTNETMGGYTAGYGGEERLPSLSEWDLKILARYMG